MVLNMKELAALSFYHSIASTFYEGKSRFKRFEARPWWWLAASGGGRLAPQW
jgi:hypothetical protein